MGYGKAWEQMYEGSMFGLSTDVMAVWNYVIAKFRVDHDVATVELNPTKLAAQFSSTPQLMWAAIGILMEADPHSRTKEHDGKRLLLDTAENPQGPMTFIVPNGPHYRKLRDEAARRSSKSESQARWRAKKKDGEVSPR